jgi:hypothetical protein
MKKDVADLAANRLPVCNKPGMSARTIRNRDHHGYRRVARRDRTASVGPPQHTRRQRKHVDPPAAAAPSRSPRQSLRLASLVFIQYSLLALDVRFIATANYLGIAVVNVCIAITTWHVTKGIVAARTMVDRICFVVGGSAGAVLAVYLT